MEKIYLSLFLVIAISIILLILFIKITTGKKINLKTIIGLILYLCMPILTAVIIAKLIMKNQGTILSIIFLVLIVLEITITIIKFIKYNKNKKNNI